MRLTSRLAILAGIAGLAAPLGLAAATAPAGAAGAPSEWPQYGQSPRHLNTNPAEKTFTPGNVGGLHTLFTADFGSNTLTEGGPAVANGMMYIGGSDGNLNAYPAAGCGQPSCQPAWRGVADNDFTSTPAVVGPSGSAVVTLSQLPRRTAGPSAASASAVASVVLPTPASPPRNTSRPLPPAASLSNPSSEARKLARSISTSVIKALVSGGTRIGQRDPG